MQSTEVINVPKDVVHKGHVHFYDYVAEFHGLDNQPTFEDQNRSIQNQLRQQYLSNDDWEQKLCLRNCFKFNRRSYIDFCLEKKCGGVDFKRAAHTLGYVK